MVILIVAGRLLVDRRGKDKQNQVEVEMIHHAKEMQGAYCLLYMFKRQEM